MLESQNEKHFTESIFSGLLRCILFCTPLHGIIHIYDETRTGIGSTDGMKTLAWSSPTDNDISLFFYRFLHHHTFSTSNPITTVTWKDHTFPLPLYKGLPSPSLLGDFGIVSVVNVTCLMYRIKQCEQLFTLQTDRSQNHHSHVRCKHILPFAGPGRYCL